MTLQDALASLGVALAAGALVGAERQQAQSAQGRTDFGGVRTFPLIALAGAVGALALPVVGVWLLVALLGVIGALLTVAHLRQEPTDPGISTEVAAAVTFGLGALSALPEVLPSPDRFLLVVAAAALVMATLSLKRPLHGFFGKVSSDDLFATVKFLVVAAVVLPILPDRGLGPWEAFNPFKVGLMIALVAGLSFAGYVAARVFGGRRGILLAGLLGGLVSSTAVTLSFSGRARAEPRLTALCALAILVASATMFARLVAIVAFVDPPLLGVVAGPMLATALAGFGLAWWLFRRDRQEGDSEAVPLTNPFALKQAVKFGLLYAVVLFVARAAHETFGASGVYASSALAGLADVDAIALSLADLHRGGLAAEAAATGLFLAAGVNTIVKVAIAFALGGVPLGKRVGLLAIVALVVGGIALAITAR